MTVVRLHLRHDGSPLNLLHFAPITGETGETRSGLPLSAEFG
jgi:hypothetical protein